MIQEGRYLAFVVKPAIITRRFSDELAIFLAL